MCTEKSFSIILLSSREDGSCVFRTQVKYAQNLAQRFAKKKKKLPSGKEEGIGGNPPRKHARAVQSTSQKEGIYAYPRRLGAGLPTRILEFHRALQKREIHTISRGRRTALTKRVLKLRRALAISCCCSPAVRPHHILRSYVTIRWQKSSCLTT